jgi:hypothetical protein
MSEPELKPYVLVSNKGSMVFEEDLADLEHQVSRLMETGYVPTGGPVPTPSGLVQAMYVPPEPPIYVMEEVIPDDIDISESLNS